jgi:hypothetical protein
MDIPVLGCWNELDPMSQMPQRRPYVSRTASFASGADSPVQVLEECLTEIDRWEAAVGAFTVIHAAAARAAAEASAERWRAGALTMNAVTTDQAHPLMGQWCNNYDARLRGGEGRRGVAGHCPSSLDRQ